MKFCCSKLKSELWNCLSSESNKDKSIVYDPVLRMYAYYTKKKRTLEESECQPIDYCPFCGTKLPYFLYDDYFLILEELFGRAGCSNLLYEHPKTHAYCLDRDKIPEEFKEFRTDEWWIKRGL